MLVNDDRADPVTERRGAEDAPAERDGEQRRLKPLIDALNGYFDLMYDCDTSHLDDVFHATANLHGFRDGKFTAWSLEAYRDILSARRSPKSQAAARADELLLVDFVSDDMAFTKVRLKINEMTFVDYLTWHRIGGRWRISAKGFHLENPL